VKVIIFENKSTNQIDKAMKTLICSDIHDHLQNLENALEAAHTAGCSSIICCGDLCSPFVIDHIHQHWNGPVHIVFGNNDGDKISIYRKSLEVNKSRSPHAAITIHGEFLLSKAGEHLDGIPEQITLAVYHYPQPALAIAESGLFKCVFYGHTHRPALQKIGDCLAANPGSLMGYIPGESDIKPSCLIINWENGETDLISLQ
jgi:putative phosphoesterase